MEIIKLLEEKLQPEFMNSVYSWKEIKDALEEIEKPCMPDNVNTEYEYYQYLSDIRCITWEFVDWIEKATGECLIKGCFENKDFEAVGIKNCGEIVDIRDIKRIRKKYDCLHNQFCDKQSKDGKMFCEHEKG